MIQTVPAQSATRQTLEAIVHFIKRHPRWWRSQIARASTLFEDESLEQWLHYAQVAHEDKAAEHALASFVRLVDDGAIEWLTERDENTQESLLLQAARMRTLRVTTRAPFSPVLH